MRVNSRCRCRADVGVRRDQVARARQQIDEVERAGRRLQLPDSASVAPASSCCRQAARSASASLLELLQVGEERVARGEHVGARRRPCRTCSRCPCACATSRGRATRSTSRASQPSRSRWPNDCSSRICRLSRRTRVGVDEQVVALGRRRRRERRRGDAARRRARSISARAIERRPLPRLRESRATRPASRPALAQPLDRTVAVAAAERRRARPAQRAAHALGRISQRLLQPARGTRAS